MPQSEVRRAFDFFDADGSHQLERVEAIAAFTHFYPEESVTAIIERIRAADLNHDGNLSFEEFARIAEGLIGGAGGGEGAAAPGARSNTANCKVQLVRFFSRYNPEKVTAVDSLLQSYAGREGELWEMLTATYGPDLSTPYAPPPIRASASSPFGTSRYNKPVAAVDKTNASAAGRASSITDQKARLTSFFRRNNADKIETVDATLQAYAGRENELWEMLTGLYGPDASIPYTAPPAASRHDAFSSSGKPAAVDKTNGKKKKIASAVGSNDHKVRLATFFKRNQPDKIETVDATLQAYAGREDELWEMLTGLYGPEPTVGKLR